MNGHRHVLGNPCGVGAQPSIWVSAAPASLYELNLGVDLIATSDGWGAEKPTPAFFTKLIASPGRQLAEIAYVGDRLDNDILPAFAAGLPIAVIRRGLRGLLLRHPPRSRTRPLARPTASPSCPSCCAS